VVEGDAREDDDARGEDVRGAATSAEPARDDGDVDLRFGKREQRSGRQRLELRGRNGLGPGSDPGYRSFEVEFGSVEPDPLLPRNDVRGQIRTHGQTTVEQQRLGQPRRRRLAVRADDVDRREPLLRLAELA